MPRIAGVNIPDQKQIKIALTYIYGIGQSLASKILAEAGIDPNRRAKDLTASEVKVLKEIIEKKGHIQFDWKMREILQFSLFSK